MKQRDRSFISTLLTTSDQVALDKRVMCAKQSAHRGNAPSNNRVAFVLVSQLCILILMHCSLKLTAGDNDHFYRAPYFPEEARFSTSWLMTGTAILGSVETEKGFNKSGKKVPLLGIYGPENLHKLGIAAPGNGLVIFEGTFNLFETQLHGYWNFTHGFFTHLHLPIRRMSIEGVRAEPQSEIHNTRAWHTALDTLNDLLISNNLPHYGRPFHATGAGDLSILLGWAYTYYKTCCLDFIDLSVQTGVLAPTSPQQSICHPFALPLGYDGHTALPLLFDSTFGVLGWLNIGIHAKGLFFFDTTRNLRVAHFDDPTGFIRLKCTRAKIRRDPLVCVGGYLKADHFFQGISLQLGYLFDHQGRDHFLDSSNLEPENDPRFAGWDMHTIHVMVEFDCATLDFSGAPTLRFMYDKVLGGKRIFGGAMNAGVLSLSCDWRY